jgi:hypothetical protein
MVRIGYNHSPLHKAGASVEALHGQQKKYKKEIDSLGRIG